MPHAIERLLATPRIRPRLPRINSEVAGMTLPVQAGRCRPLPYGIGPKAHQARRLTCPFGNLNSIHFREYVQQAGVCPGNCAREATFVSDPITQDDSVFD